MSMLIKVVDIPQPLTDFIKAIIDTQLKHYASDLFPELEVVDENIFNTSLTRAQQVCTTLNLPLHQHFRKIYRTSCDQIYCDYRLSHTAYLLVGINGDVGSKKVARIQMELINKLLGNT